MAEPVGCNTKTNAGRIFRIATFNLGLTVLIQFQDIQKKSMMQNVLPPIGRARMMTSPLQTRRLMNGEIRLALSATGDTHDQKYADRCSPPGRNPGCCH